MRRRRRRRGRGASAAPHDRRARRRTALLLLLLRGRRRALGRRRSAVIVICLVVRELSLAIAAGGRRGPARACRWGSSRTRPRRCSCCSGLHLEPRLRLRVGKVAVLGGEAGILCSHLQTERGEGVQARLQPAHPPHTPTHRSQVRLRDPRVVDEGHLSALDRDRALDVHVHDWGDLDAEGKVGGGLWAVRRTTPASGAPFGSASC